MSLRFKNIRDISLLFSSMFQNEMCMHFMLIFNFVFESMNFIFRFKTNIIVSMTGVYGCGATVIMFSP